MADAAAGVLWGALCAILIVSPIMWVVLLIVRQKRRTELLMGGQAVATTQSLLSKADASKDYETAHEASYFFAAEMRDGGKCIVEVQKRAISTSVIDQIESMEKQRVRVRYLPEDPRCCRLEIQAQHDLHVNPLSGYCTMSFTLSAFVFLGVIFLVGFHIGLKGIGLKAPPKTSILVFWVVVIAVSLLIIISCRLIPDSRIGSGNCCCDPHDGYLWADAGSIKIMQYTPDEVADMIRKMEMLPEPPDPGSTTYGNQAADTS